MYYILLDVLSTTNNCHVSPQVVYSTSVRVPKVETVKSPEKDDDIDIDAI